MNSPRLKLGSVQTITDHGHRTFYVHHIYTAVSACRKYGRSVIILPIAFSLCLPFSLHHSARSLMPSHVWSHNHCNAANNKRCSFDIVQIHSPAPVAQISTARYRSLFSYLRLLSGPVAISKFHRSCAEESKGAQILFKFTSCRSKTGASVKCFSLTYSYGHFPIFFP